MVNKFVHRREDRPVLVGPWIPWSRLLDYRWCGTTCQAVPVAPLYSLPVPPDWRCCSGPRGTAWCSLSMWAAPCWGSLWWFRCLVGLWRMRCSDRRWVCHCVPLLRTEHIEFFSGLVWLPVVIKNKILQKVICYSVKYHIHVNIIYINNIKGFVF